MTEPAVAEQPAPTQGTGRRGRPRPQATIERDARVLEMLKTHGAAGATRTTLVADLNHEVKPSHVYLSLFRLRRGGQVTRNQAGGSHTWTPVASSETASDATVA